MPQLIPNLSAIYYSVRICETPSLLSLDPQNRHDVSVKSRVQFKVWKRSESKKKNKKRVLVASTEECILDLLKKQYHDKSKPSCPV